MSDLGKRKCTKCGSDFIVVSSDEYAADLISRYLPDWKIGRGPFGGYNYSKHAYSFWNSCQRFGVMDELIFAMQCRIDKLEDEVEELQESGNATVTPEREP